MNKKVLLVSSLLVSLMGYSQTVKGRVVQHDNPVSNASIILKKGDKEMTSMTDASGFFNVTLTEGGSYTISIVAEGANPMENQITVEDNGVLDLGDVIVYQMVTSEPVVEEKPVAEQPTEPTEPAVAQNTQDPNEPQDEEENGKVKKLQTVEIVGRARKDYNSDYSFSASKIALKNMEVSQAITTVTKELITDRGVTRLGDVVKNVSGVNQTSFYNLYSIRGVTQASGYRENRLVNGMATSVYFFSQPLMMNIERVEVIKGPASMTFSSTDPGGSINMVTKKPLTTNRKEVSLSVGSYGTIVGALDFTGPLNKDKSLLYRLNLGYENSGSFRDLQFKKAYMIAPTFTYIPNDKTRMNVELVLTNNNNRLDRGQPIFRANAGEKPALNSTPITYAIGAVNDYNKTLDINLMGNLTHQFNEHIGLNLAYMKHIWHEDLVELRTNNNFGKDATGTRHPYWVEMRYVQRQQKFLTDNINAYLNANWNIGESIKNKTVAGYDFIAFEVSNAGGTNTVRDYTGDATSGTLTPRIPHWDLRIKDGSQYKVMYPGLYQPQAKRITSIVPMYYNTNAIYVMNQLEWNRLIFNFGLRQEWYTDKNYYKTDKEEVVKQNKLLARAGLVYKLTDNINLYASYVEGFQMQTDAYLGSDTFRRDGNTGAIARDPFKPKTSRMWEGGIKSEWFDGKLQATLAYYNIKQKNVLTYADGSGQADELSNEGATEKNQGIELEVMGRILPNWMINAGYAYIDANLTRFDNASNKDITYRKDNAPKHSLNIWTRYDIKEGPFRNFGAGAGLNYVGEKISWQERDLVLPAYTVVDAAVYYKLKSMQLSFNVNNIFNKEYWVGAFNYPRLFPGTPRNVLFTVKYTF